MKFAFYIAKRYVFTFSKNTAINIITIISSVGIVVGALSLFVVLSVFSGLRDFSLQFTNDYDPDFKVVAKTGKWFEITPQHLNQLKKTSGFVNCSKTVEDRVLFYFNQKQHVTYLKGIDENYTKTNKIAQKLYAGQWINPNTYQATIGYTIAQKLGVGVFDFNNPLEVIAPKPGKGNLTLNPEDSFNKDQLLVVGIFAVNDELDSKYVFTDITFAQNLLSLQPNQISALEINCKTNNEEETIATISKIFNHKVTVKTRAQLNQTLYKMLNTENFILYLIFTLVIIMILFAFTGSIIMVIIDKKNNLKTLYSLGTETKILQKIFLAYGTLICFFGGLIGIVFGAIIVLLQQQQNIIMITETLPYPVKFTVTNFVVVLATITILGFVASYIASSRVNKNLLD